MKTWLAIGVISGLAFGGWLSHAADEIELFDGLAVGLVCGLMIAFGFASIPWKHMGRREW